MQRELGKREAVAGFREGPRGKTDVFLNDRLLSRFSVCVPVLRFVGESSLQPLNFISSQQAGSQTRSGCPRWHCSPTSTAACSYRLRDKLRTRSHYALPLSGRDRLNWSSESDFPCYLNGSLS